MNENVTMEDPEIRELYEELLKQNETIQKRNQLSEQSFKIWLCQTLQVIAQKLGYFIQGLAVFIDDMNFSIQQGFKAGREEARKRSLRRAYEGDDDI